jgi:hypothetical protein
MSSRSEESRTAQQGVKARFVSWQIAEPVGNQPHRLDSVGPAEVSFQLEVNSPIGRAHQGIALFDMERRLMWAYSNDDLTLEVGVHDLRYKFPFLPLCPGSYTWQMSLWDETGNVDMWEALPELQVAIPNYQHARDEWNGFLNLPSTLSVSSRKG